MVPQDGQCGHGQAKAEALEKSMPYRRVANLVQAFESAFRVFVHFCDHRLQQFDL
ncbi:hypothetical protein D3C81_1966550 [compost metagenome]